MKNLLRKIYKIFFKKILNDIRFFTNTKFNIGNKKQCYICKKRFRYFGKYRKGTKGLNDFVKNLNVVGSDVDNFKCFFCGCHDRTRHLFMYFDKINFWENFKESKTLHIAPEKELIREIRKYNIQEYMLGDLNPYSKELKKIDVTNIPYPNEYFTIVICNHVLEHVVEYQLALKEIYRVLKPKGFAILQTPYSSLLEKNFEDASINTDKLRLFFYAQEDHVRFFSKKHFFNDLINTGFKLNILEHKSLFNPQEASFFGVNEKEDLILVYK